MSSHGDGDFHFWTETASQCHVTRSTSPWKSMEDECPSSPLLPYDHSYSSGHSPASRRRAIEQGRRELLEMTLSMPESSFDLSLKDIVEEHLKSKEPIEGIDNKKKKQKSMKKRKTVNVAGPVSRTCSMDSGTFMIKMFFPAFLASRRVKTRGGSQSKCKVSPRTSMDGAEDRKDCRSWSLKSQSAADQKVHDKNSSRRSTSCRDGRRGEQLPSCWPFEKMKSTLRRQRTCNF
ncbi:hypothetical protein SAY86_016947 [Trapa natans]|uniref:Uncharacterized protein n=1 Tax=Trapa natans TaxID=22666 RepID=A0AAN7LJU8_TRANT|nr:hypothetical protein SAY86_016947 [Trapa natans]